MVKMIDLTGKRFGRLTVIEQSSSTERGLARWLCKCDCGNYCVSAGVDLRRGHVKSCGCLQKEQAKAVKTKHGLRYTKLNGIWKSMKKRCHNENELSYSNYGGRGITVCDEWKEDFQAFYDWAMANGYRNGLSIDRIDVNGNYCPENCRWATRKEQNNNTRSNHLLTYNGETHTMSEWAEITGMGYGTLQSRINRYGWPIEKALTEPVRQYKSADKAVNK